MHEFRYISTVGEFWLPCRIVMYSDDGFLIAFKDPFSYLHRNKIISKEELRESIHPTV
jgi:hypothetical protein